MFSAWRFKQVVTFCLNWWWRIYRKIVGLSMWKLSKNNKLNFVRVQCVAAHRIRWLILALQGQTKSSGFFVPPCFPWQLIAFHSMFHFIFKTKRKIGKWRDKNPHHLALYLYTQEMCNISYLHIISILPHLIVSRCSTGASLSCCWFSEFPPVAMIYDRNPFKWIANQMQWFCKVKANNFRLCQYIYWFSACKGKKPEKGYHQSRVQSSNPKHRINSNIQMDTIGELQLSKSLAENEM